VRDFDDRVAGNPPKFARNARFIAHLDIDASEIDKVKRVDMSYVGLMPDALRTLIDYGRRLGSTRSSARGGSDARSCARDMP